MAVCECGTVIDNEACQCSLTSSDCLEVAGSGNGVGLSVTPIPDPDPDNLWTCEDDGALVALPVHVRNPPRCQVYHDAAQTLTNNTPLVVAFNQERYDTDTMHDNTTLNSRITIVTAGIYVVTFVCAVEDNGDGDRQALIRKNGNEFLGGNEKKAASAAFETGLNVTIQEALLAGEYLEAIVKQDSGTGLDLLSTRYSPVLTAQFRRLLP